MTRQAALGMTETELSVMWGDREDRGVEHRLALVPQTSLFIMRKKMAAHGIR